MNTKTLYLAWQDKKDRQWFPIGRLDADVERQNYRYRYIGGAKRAQEEVKFQLLPDFPELEQDYKSSELFSIFKNRVIALGRPDRADYLDKLALPEHANPIEILTVNGGRRVTDAYEVFPELVKKADGSFTYRFFLHGSRHVEKDPQKRIDALEKEEPLFIVPDPDNPVDKLALKIQTKDECVLGWVPRYLASNLTKKMLKHSENYEAKVVRINPQPAPSRQRLLIEMSGHLDEPETMNSEDFKPLVA